MNTQQWVRFGGVALLVLGAASGCGDDSDGTGGSAATGSTSSGSSNTSSSASSTGTQSTSASSGANSSAGGTGAGNGEGGGGAGGSGDGGVGDLTDGQVGSLAQTANRGEVDQAEAARAKLENADVQAFAAMMIADHGQAADQLDALLLDEGIVPMTSEEEQLLREGSDENVATLEAAAAPADATYVQTQVAAHTQVLTLIEEKLLPEVQNDALEEFLQTMREAVEMHLQEAEALQDGLDG